MVKENYKSVVAHYTGLVEQHGIAYQSLDWGSKKSQELRFGIMSQVSNLEGKKILDIGCGLADFWEYLQRQAIHVNYTGYDITPAMVEQASLRFPQLQIECKNILEDKVEEKFDYVFASGIFAFLPKDKEQLTMELIIKKMFELSTSGVVFNSLSSWADKKEENEFQADPLAMTAFCKKMARNIVLRHDYFTHDFTIYMYKK